MPETNRLSGDSDWIELAFLEHERTSEHAMKLSIQMHLAGLSLSDTVSSLDDLGVERHRTTTHRWVQKADFSSPVAQARITSPSTKP